MGKEQQAELELWWLVGVSITATQGFTVEAVRG